MATTTSSMTTRHLYVRRDPVDEASMLLKWPVAWGKYYQGGSRCKELDDGRFQRNYWGLGTLMSRSIFMNHQSMRVMKL